MKKRFSVVVAAYNREKYIRETINSVLSQTFNDYELIIVDDGSTDHTWEILQSYGDQITSTHQLNQGPEAAFRKGASLAKGEYLAFLDSDDLFMPCALATYDVIIRSFDLPPLIIGSRIRFQDGQDIPMGGGSAAFVEVLKYRDYLSKEISLGIAQSIIVIQMIVFEEIYKDQDRLASQRFFNYDYKLVLLAGTYGPCVIVKEPVTVAYREHGSQNSLNVEIMGKGVLDLIKMVRRGQCFGYCFQIPAKYVYLAGPIYEWINKAIESKQPRLAFSLLLNGWPMLLFSVMRKFSRCFRHPIAPIFIKV
jgi:glycosyltransferase involved in cell wall biosynthesis